MEDIVAPLVGAWIEILYSSLLPLLTHVAPLVGAWIEIKLTHSAPNYTNGRSPCGSVD